METKHTPGPWLSQWDHDGEYTIWSRGEDGVIHEIARLNAQYDDIRIPAKANACLITAAPELLEIVLEIRGLICEAAETGFNPLSGDWAERLYKTQAASYVAVDKAGANPRSALALSQRGSEGRGA